MHTAGRDVLHSLCKHMKTGLQDNSGLKCCWFISRFVLFLLDRTTAALHEFTVQRIILLHLTLSLQPIIILILQFLDMCECSETVHWSTDVWESFLRPCHPNMIIGVVLIQDWK